MSVEEIVNLTDVISSIVGDLSTDSDQERMIVKRAHREIEAKRRNRPQHKRVCGLVMIHDGNHRGELRDRCAALVRLDLAGRRAFFCRNSCKATALLCCVSCEL